MYGVKVRGLQVSMESAKVSKKEPGNTTIITVLQAKGQATDCTAFKPDKLSSAKRSRSVCQK